MQYLDKVDRISSIEKSLENTRMLWNSKDITSGERDVLDTIFYRLHREMFELTVELDYDN